MKLCTKAFTAVVCLVLLHSKLSALPAVSEDYSQMAAGVHLGKRLNEIIKTEDVSSISLIENRGKGSLIAKGFCPHWKSDELLQSAFTTTHGAENWGLSATEGSYARYALITKKGELFLLEVVCDQMKGGVPTALLIHCQGFGCRIDLPMKITIEQDSVKKNATRDEPQSEGGDQPQPEAEGRSR